MHRPLASLALVAVAAFSLTAQSAPTAAGAAPPPRQVAPHAAVSSHPLAIDSGADAVWQSLLKLHTRASLIMVTAHPDDEDSGLLAYASRGLGARVDLLTLNRGEGGQNLKSDDFNTALGLIRTQELLAADRDYGVQQFFTPAVDFGFSKTLAETQSKWGRQRMLEQAVRVVRMTRPLVVTSVFVGGPSDGHGHHQEAGVLAQQVYLDAGNPKMFPRQIKDGLQPWTPLKVYARVPVRDFTPRGIYDYANLHYTPNRIYDYVHKKWIEGVPSITDSVPEGSVDSTLKMSYSQIGGQGRQHHKTQFNFAARRGPAPGRGGRGRAGTPYHLYASRVKTTAHETSLFAGIDTSLMGIAGDLPNPQSPAARSLRSALAAINTQVESAMHAFNRAAPAAIAPTLAQGLAATRALIQQVQSESLPALAKYNVLHELNVKQTQFNDALVEALGLSLDATAASSSGRELAAAFPGEHLDVSVRLNNGADPVQLTALTLGGATAGSPAGTGGGRWTIAPAAAPAGSLAAHANRTASFTVTVPAGAQLTRPYFTRPTIEQSYYNITDPRFRNLPQMPYPLAAWARMSYHGVPFQFGEVVQTYATGLAGAAPAEVPLPVAPAISVAITPAIGILPLPAAPFALIATVRGNVPGGASGALRLKLPAGWTAAPATAPFHLAAAGDQQRLAFRVTPAHVGATPVTITAVATYDGHQYQQGYRTVGYPGLRPTNYYTPATYRTRGVNVHLAQNLKVGYIPGTGDDVPASLAGLGVTVHAIPPASLATANLDAYNVIVLGIRTYNAGPALAANNARLLAFVHQGGVLIVQYQSSGFDHAYGPYPYTLGGNGARVVDETSAVQILAPNNPVLSWPNKITTADFKGWIEERGHGFMASWDSHYTALVSMHDPGQAPQKGGLLYAPYGKGVYVYEGLALYRQLDQGVPGAFRIFANLLSLPDRPKN